METLIINIPTSKSALVKEILTQFGISFKKGPAESKKPSDYLGAISEKEAIEILGIVNEERAQWERNI